MAYDDGLAERIRDLFAGRQDITEKKMFGGVSFMQNGNMCVGIVKSDLCCRVGKTAYEHALAQPHAREMDFTKRPMKGWVFVAPAGFESDADLKKWVELCEANSSSLPPK
jgi:TfoX/Sxy family transcriptional regulator of competence genes